MNKEGHIGIVKNANVPIVKRIDKVDLTTHLNASIEQQQDYSPKSVVANKLLTPSDQKGNLRNSNMKLKPIQKFKIDDQ